MTTLTDKELIKEIKERISSLEVRDDIERRAYEIALASLEEEPVAWLHSDNGLGIPAITRSKNIADSWLSKGWYVQPLYIAKPVLVVPDARPSLNNGIVGFDEGWNACRATMLHGAKPVSQTYKLPVNTPCQDAPAHIWLQTAGVWPEDGELSELTWCSHNQHHDDTLYVRADLVHGNYPVTPDGWISCSERMPEKYDFDIWVFPPSRGVLDGLQWDGSMFTDDEYQFVIHDATHWMRKAYPAAPQQDGE
ncbi:DUF551 domain-containing protein [Escherichia coli]|nr:DUF551 domain-containing protein [Escherichia coli]ELO4332071.1 DUF551 domain-containing protein [Escherichia coli]ELO4899216.1 DUF551 domain-containing protein [Escherichia coli]